MGKRRGHFVEEDIQMANKMERCSMSFVIKKMQIELQSENAN